MWIKTSREAALPEHRPGSLPPSPHRSSSSPWLPRKPLLFLMPPSILPCFNSPPFTPGFSAVAEPSEHKYGRC